MVLSNGAIAGIVVAVVLVLGVVLSIGLLICRMVYRHEHGKVPPKRRKSGDSQGRMRGKVSGSSIGSNVSGNTDFFVNKEEFNTMLAGVEESWASKGIPQLPYTAPGLNGIDGATVFSNPVFDTDRGQAFEAAITIQSWFRGCQARRQFLSKRPASKRQDRSRDRRSSVASNYLYTLPMYCVKTYGLVPTGGHRNTSTETLTRCLEQMHKRQSRKKREEEQVRHLRLFVTAKGLKVMAPEVWVIRHHIPLKDLYSFMVSPFNSRVFACIFRRKGITYCFAVSCDGEDASLICKTLQDAHLASTIQRIGSTRRSSTQEFQARASRHSTGGNSTAAGYLSGLGTPWTSGVDLQEYQRRGQRLSAVSTGSAEDTVFRDSAPPSELAATVIQSWYRGHRARKEARSAKEEQMSSRRGSRSIELLSSLTMHPCLLCSLAPVAYDRGNDKDTLTTALQHTSTDIAHRHVLVGVSAKGLTVLTSDMETILHKIPLRVVRTFLVSPVDATIFAVLFRSRAGSICLVMKCPDAQLLCKTVHEAQLASTLLQLEKAKSTLPDNYESRGLLESASTIVANLPGTENAGGAEGGSTPGLTADLSAPLAESVTITLKVESSIGDGDGAAQASQSKTHKKTLSSSHSLSDIGSASSMSAEAFAAAAHSLLDNTLRETAEFVAAEMSRSPSKEMRAQVEDMITESTQELLDEVGSDTQARPGNFATSTPKKHQPGEGEEPGTSDKPAKDNMSSTIQGLLYL